MCRLVCGSSLKQEAKLQASTLAGAGGRSCSPHAVLFIFFHSSFKTPDVGEEKHNGEQIERSAAPVRSKCIRQYLAATGDNNFKWQSLHY